MSKKFVGPLVAIVAIGVAIWLVLFNAHAVVRPVVVDQTPTTTPATTTAPAQSYECNADAKICPDGSAVGRTGPDCHFTACPAPAATSATLRTTMGQKVTGMNVSLTPTAIVEDSRCPADVQCIWAGTVKVRTKIQSGMGTSEMVLELGKPVTTEAETITLTEVTPSKKSGEEIPVSSYRFVFEAKKR